MNDNPTPYWQFFDKDDNLIVTFNISTSKDLDKAIKFSSFFDDVKVSTKYNRPNEDRIIKFWEDVDKRRIK